MSKQYTKWVATWGNGISRTECLVADYAKNITLRYPIVSCFDGNKIRLRFSNFTGTEAVTLSEVTVAKTLSGSSVDEETMTMVTFHGEVSVTMKPGEQIVSDEIDFCIESREEFSVSIYLKDYTQMREGVMAFGPLSPGYYFYGDYAKAGVPNRNDERKTQCFYFLNTVDILTEEKNHAIVCFGDSITSQSWPDELQTLCWEHEITNVSVIRRAVCGSRILREYDCIEYAAYGLKGATRFPLEIDTAGADQLIILHGINDIIHPVGEEINVFRPMSDMPTVDDLINGIKSIYLAALAGGGWKIYGATAVPFGGWRTYADFREEIRNAFNEWFRTTDSFDGCIDFDRAVRDPEHLSYFHPECDSGDHLHPSEEGHYRMAKEAFRVIFGNSSK